MLNKKGIEEEGTRFSKENIINIIIFLLILTIAILIIFPRLNAGETISSFGEYVLTILGVE